MANIENRSVNSVADDATELLRSLDGRQRKGLLGADKHEMRLLSTAAETARTSRLQKTREDGAGRDPGVLTVGCTERKRKERVSERAAIKGKREGWGGEGANLRRLAGWVKLYDG